MNLKDAGGRVPLQTGDPDMPYRLVDFPSRDQFDKLMPRLSQASRDKYWTILTKRAAGATLSESAVEYGVTKERVRQIEAKFLRLMRLSALG